MTLELEALQGFKRLSDAPEVYAEGVSVRIVAAPPEGTDAPPDINDLSLELVSFMADDAGSYTLRFVLGCVVGERTLTVATRSFELYFEN